MLTKTGARNEWPAILRCYGRTYRANDEWEFIELLKLLEFRDLHRARKYRIPPQLPRDGTLWECGDCQCRHRAWKLTCPISNRLRHQAQTHE